MGEGGGGREEGGELRPNNSVAGPFRPASRQDAAAVTVSAAANSETNFRPLPSPPEGEESSSRIVR